MLYVFKKGAAINQKIYVLFPQLIRLMLEDPRSEFNHSSLIKLNIQIIYYISKEKKHFETLKCCCKQQMERLLRVHQAAKKTLLGIQNSISTLLHRLTVYNELECNIHTKIDVDGKKDFVHKYLHTYQKLLETVSDILNNTNTTFSTFNVLRKQYLQIVLSYKYVEETVLNASSFDNL